MISMSPYSIQYVILYLIVYVTEHDRTVRMYNAHTFELLHVLSTGVHIPEWHTCTYLALEPNGSLVACATQNGFVCVWSLLTWERVAVGRLHAGSVEGLRWSSTSGLLATCSADCMVTVLRVNRSCLQMIPTREQHCIQELKL